jgi:hypothetical protein
MATQFLLVWSVIVIMSLVPAEPYTYLVPLLAGLGTGLIALGQPLAPNGIRAIPSKSQLFIFLVASLAIAVSTPYTVRILEQYVLHYVKRC